MILLLAELRDFVLHILLSRDGAVDTLDGCSSRQPECFVTTLWTVLTPVIAHPQFLMLETTVCMCSKFAVSFIMLFQLVIVERCEATRCLQAKFFGALTSRGKSRRFGKQAIGYTDNCIF